MPVFVFDRIEVIDSTTLLAHYGHKFENGSHEHFSEKLVLPCKIDNSDEITQRILRSLHIALGISYYKAFLGEVELPYHFDDEEAVYWNTVYHEGLGEFAYINQITAPIRPFMASTTSNSPHPVHLNTSGALLGIGGGKDSIVAGEILKKTDLRMSTWELSTGTNRGQAGVVMDKMGLDQLQVARYFDTNLVEVVKERGGHNGHIPISMIFAWVGILLAYAGKYQYVVMGNESATSVGNVDWAGRNINHQWSKSFEFETLMQGYVHKTISPNITYLSLLRSYGSLKVMQLFHTLASTYTSDFTSCNFVFRIDPMARPNGRWCGACAKCLSSYLLLSAWKSDEQLEKIFGKNLLLDPSLQSTLNELVGLVGNKPMDCVGTIDELRACARKLITEGRQGTLLAGISIDALSGSDINSLVEETHEHAIPKELLQKVEAAQ